MNGVAVPGTWTPRGVTNFGLDTDLEFNEADFSFLETYNQSAPFEPFDCRSASDRGLLPDACEARAVPSYRGVALGAEAFRKSVWRFTPVSKDCATSEQENISLPLRDAYDSPESHIGADRRATAERLSQASRDAILAMVLQASKPESRRRLTMSFPSTELLDTLLQYYLTCPFSTASSWLHFPSFDPNKVECPELLTGMIATGAALAPDSALNKLGFALQEVLRTTLSVVFEEDNTRVRNLQLWQTFLLVLQVGLWSGNSRKIEIAESFLQPLVTMVRRSGSFRRSSYAPIVVQPDDDEKILAQRWKDWVRQESYKRFVYHLFQHDTQVSMCLMFFSPLISYAEMHLPLPESRELWLAESAEAWKYALMRVTRHIYSDRHISLVEGIKQIDCFSILGPVIDRHESRKALLYGLWRLVWEYRQFSSLIKVNTNHYGLIMSSRFQELHQSLQNFRICCDEPLAPTVDSKWITLTLELVFMHLHMSMEDVQVFAGLEGEADAKRIYPSLCSWFNTSAARQAIWHAGQVVRVAKLQASRHLRGFYSVALYHSTLAFWAYGVILQSRDRVEPLSTEPDSQPTHSDPVVWLDGPENVDVKRFVSLNRGSPALQDPQAHGGVALISIPPAVMDIVIKTLQDNHDHDGTSSNGSRPPLIENLVQLLRGLQSGSRAAAS
ncbi:hypothetical protein P152DRAFT_389602 [Eremomyces bilateralis CBS 781.70]|uniref:Xylanolytic transcriptional activator regulatory domain-containing protein n=1 Tax=Eremomyces bilateralis CBS 781.70 TaxID=1392243 RepID=A0A6G1GED5_9PEZI|nr:uncharacterized protein P152DRAFT_389602 [Eremomyces bilateralis CBS 781.70]KAF1816413.1 hypothetical protein P152DRAFT_389602 [Eremomyces bilateralis CBS 781.70]